jgi:phage portal protein BeeE
MFTWISRLLGGGEEVRRLREELALAKVAGGHQLIAPSSPGAFSGSRDLAGAREQLRHNAGWVAASVRATAQTIAGQPIRVARKVRGRRTTSKATDLAPAWVKALDGVEVLDNHPLLAAFRDPNPLHVGWSLLYLTAASLELTGRAFWMLADEPGGLQNGLQIWPLAVPWCRPKHTAERWYDSWEVKPRGLASGFTVPGDDMLHFSYPDAASPLEGAASPLQSQAKAVVADEAIQESQRRAFANGVNPGHAVYVGRNPGVNGQQGNRPVLTEAQRAQVINGITAAYRGVANHGHPFIVDGHLEKIERISNTPAEMDYLDSGKAAKERVCQGMGVNEIILGQVEGSNRASSLAAADHFNSYTINPKISLISQCLTSWLSWRYRDPSLVVFLEECRAQDPEQTRADLALAAKFGACTKDELRAQAGLPPLGPGKGGDELVAPAPAGGNGAKRSRARRKFVGPGGLGCRCHGERCVCGAGGNGKGNGLILPK